MRLFSRALLLALPALVSSKAILGVDMGSLYMKVALVQRGAPLEIVTNFHSKRKTENMILFDAGTRFYGADASSLLARKPLKTPVQMSLMLGRDEDHPCVATLGERHFPVTPKFNETRNGLSLSVDNQDYTPEELVAMVLHHSKDMAQTYIGELGKDAKAAPADCVLTVPAFFTVHERRALLDAASLADLNVLGLLEENTAAALHYAMDKQFPEDQIFVFYNMGGTAVQVSVVKLHNYNMTSGLSSKPKTVGALEVLSKAWDATLGGQSFDHRIVEYLADEFNAKWDKQRNDGKKKDVRTVPRAMTKIRLQANKVKHVLSANMEIPIFMDSLHDDCALSTLMTRAKLEELCVDLIERATKPVYQALEYANITLSDVHGIEMIGGGMRIPRIQTDLKKALNDIELGMHINADESMALGAAFHGANLSTAFRVRHVGLLDVNPFPIRITLKELETEEQKKGLFGGGGKKKKDDGEEVWGKNATILKAFGKLGVKKTIAFTHDKDIHCALDYEEAETLPEGTPLGIDRFNITGVEDFAKEMEEKNLGKPKVALQFQLTDSGLTKLLKAEATVEEMYTVEEEVEVDDDEADDEASNATNTKEEEADADAKTEDAEDKKEEEATADEVNATEANETDTDANATSEKADEKPVKKKKKKTITQTKEKKRVHKRALTVKTYNVGKVQPYSAELLAESKAKLQALAKKDKERVLLEEAKNKVESYVYHIKNKLVDDEENIGKVSTEEQRAEVLKLAEDAEEWMYEDGSTADLATTEDKYAEISVPAEKIFNRVKEMTARPEAVVAMKGRLTKVGELMTKWETTMPQVTEEERGEVLKLVDDVTAWIKEKEEAQSKVEAHEDPAFTSAEVPIQIKPIEVLVAKLKRKPKPKPPKKNETDANATDTNSTNATDAEETNSTEAKDADSENETADEPAEGEAKEDGEKEEAEADPEEGESKKDDEL
ncbi:Hypoxia up-regulated protein 1 (Fragment) [Seminavis robusta]|uniref:Hypoxia up-regulated protein 1 n=1 Tax=Seminavis robusta TaxID=568900 RepID=A0A9N8EV22_9STRA